MDSQQFSVIVGTIIASAFFSGVEMAYISANKLYFELQAKQGVVTGVIIAKFLKQPSKFIGTMLIGNTLSLVLYGIFMEGSLHHWIAPLLEQLPDWLQFLNNEITHILIPSMIATILVLALAEFTNYIKNLNRNDNKQEETADVDTKIFNNALEFKEVRVRDCMIPRTEIVGIDVEDSIEDLRRTFVESGHSKVIVYKDTIEDVVGYCHSLELFKKPKDIKSILTPITIVPEAMPAQDLMIKMSAERRSVALVVDEYGGTAGLISLEDIVEQIFGEIQDEYDDNEDWIEKKLEDGSYLLSARHEIEYLNEKYHWNLPEGDYDTLGGLIITVNEDLPEINEVVTLAPFNFTILTMQDARIDTVRVNITGDIDERKNNRELRH